MNRRRVTLGLLLLAAASATPAGAADAAAGGRLVVEGTGPAYVDVTLKSSVRLELENNGSATDVRASYAGSYAGVVVQRPAGTVLNGALLVRDWVVRPAHAPAAFADSLPVGGKTAIQLRRGETYRFVLLSDGRASVSFSARGLRGTTRLRASRAFPGVRAQRSAMADIPAAGANPLVGRAVLPMTQSPSGLTVYLLFSAFGDVAGNDASGLTSHDVCFRPRGRAADECVQPHASSGVATAHATYATKRPGGDFSLPPGSYDLELRSATVGSPPVARIGFVLTLARA